MIKNILKLSVSMLLLLGTTIVGMDDGDGVPSLTPTVRSSEAIPQLAARFMTADAPTLTNLEKDIPSGIQLPTEGGASSTTPEDRTVLRLLAGIDARTLLAIALGMTPDCSGCPNCFPKRMALLDAKLTTFTERQAQTNADIARLTAELEALDADADKTSLTASLEALQANFADIQAKIDAIPGKLTALEAARVRAEEEASKTAAKCESLKQIFLNQIACDPRAIKLRIKSTNSTNEDRVVLLTLLQGGDFAGLRVTGATLNLTLAPATALSRVDAAADCYGAGI